MSPWPVETEGLVTILLEAGLGELPRVVAEVRKNEAAPGYRRVLASQTVRWDATVEIREGIDASSLTLSLRLCPQPGLCVGHTASAPAAALERATDELLAWSAQVLSVNATSAIREQWRRPVSVDAYARLLTGRGAAILYGWSPPIPARLVGNRAYDTIARAAYIDPSADLAQWISARTAIDAGDTTAALHSTRRALGEGSRRLPLLALHADTLTTTADSDAAREAWLAVDLQTPQDPRFVIPLIDAYLGSGAIGVAEALLDTVPTLHHTEAAVARLYVTLAQAQGPGDDFESLLAVWQQAEPHNPEPTRRRIAVLLRSGRHAEALQSVGELERRGAGAEASSLRIALATELGRYTEAADEAERVGMALVAQRIRLRAELTSEHNIRGQAEAARPRPATLESLLTAQRGLAEDPAAALRSAERALRKNPWWPEALALKTVALARLGRGNSAVQARLRLHRADPSYRLGPSTAAGNTGTGVQSQSTSP